MLRFSTAAFLRVPPNFITSLALRAPRLIVLSDLNIHVKRALGSAQDCSDDKGCGGLVYGRAKPAVWVGGTPTEHGAIVIPGGFSPASDRLTFW